MIDIDSPIDIFSLDLPFNNTSLEFRKYRLTVSPVWGWDFQALTDKGITTPERVAHAHFLT